MRQRQALSGRLVSVIGLAVLLNYVDRGNLATAAPLLQDELSLSNGEIGVAAVGLLLGLPPRNSWPDGWLIASTSASSWPPAICVVGGDRADGLAHGFASILALRLMLGLARASRSPAGC